MMLDMSSGKRVDKSKAGKPTQVPVDGPVADLLRALCKKYRRDQKEVLDASVKWLTALGKDVAGPVLNFMPDAYTSDFAKMILERMAQGDAPPIQSEEPETSPQEAEQSKAVEISMEEAAQIAKERRESRRKGRPKTGTD